MFSSLFARFTRRPSRALVLNMALAVAVVIGSIAVLSSRANTSMPDDPVLVGAGDIASCANDNDAATAMLLDGISGTVFTLGDDAYENGTAAEFANCYDATWGRHKARTRPTSGNHDYGTARAAG